MFVGIFLWMPAGLKSIDGGTVDFSGKIELENEPAGY